MERRTSGTGWKLDWIPELDRLRGHWDESGVYFLLCTPTRVGYIGSAAKFSERMKFHFGNLGTNQHPNKRMQSAYNQHGIDAFTWGIVEQCRIEDLAEREQYWINRYPPERLFNEALNVTRHYPVVKLPDDEIKRYARDYCGFDVESIKIPRGNVFWSLVYDFSRKSRYDYWFPFRLKGEYVALAGKEQIWDILP